MELETFVVPPRDVNVYLVYDPDAGQGVLVDSALCGEKVLPRIEELGLKLTHVLNTHGHVDHVADNARIAEATGAKVGIHEADAYRLERVALDARPHLPAPPAASKADILLKEGTEVPVGTATLLVLHTPGHTQGSSSFYVPDEGIVFTGDTLLAGAFGDTNRAGASPAFLWQSLRRLHSQLPPPTKVFPGHGATTRIGDETWIANLRYAAPH